MLKIIAIPATLYLGYLIKPFLFIPIDFLANIISTLLGFISLVIIVAICYGFKAWLVHVGILNEKEEMDGDSEGTRP